MRNYARARTRRGGRTGDHSATGENGITTLTPPWRVTSPSTVTLDFHRQPLFFIQPQETRQKRKKKCRRGKRASKHRAQAVDAQQLKDTGIYISSQELSNDQISLLSKGLSFVPSSGLNVFGLKVDVFKCVRRIKLRHFFSKNTDSASSTQASVFRAKSTYCPNTNNASINTFCRVVQQDIMQMAAKPHPSPANLTQSERAALNELISDRDIVIKPADTGGGICIQDSEKYKQ